MKTILLDCDGPMLDFVQTILDAGNNFLPPEQCINPEQVNAWGALFDLYPPYISNLLRSWCDTPEPWNNLDPTQGALAGVQKLKSVARVVVVTAPWGAGDCREWASVRYRKIKRHFDISERDVIIASAKDLIRGDMLIDDRPENVIAWKEANPNGRALLFDMPHNASYVLPENINRFTWGDL